MCLIVDADAAARFLAEPSKLKAWLRGKGGNPRLVAAGALMNELKQLRVVRAFLVELERAGRLRSPDGDRLRREEDQLRASASCRSNDIHVLSLAIVSGARTLATFDNDLADDFKNATIIPRPRGRIYRDPDTHNHLLGHTPASCGIQSTDPNRWRHR